MTPDNLDTLSDGELDQCFAVEVAGWKRSGPSTGCVFYPPGLSPWSNILGHVVPAFATDTNAVLPWLMRHTWEARYPGGEKVYVDIGGRMLGEATTFARAAAIALIGAKRAEAPAAQDPSAGGTWWCNAHQREATHIDHIGRRCCDPDLAGILLPCSVVLAPMVVKPSRSKKGIK